ncbi:hypothetical protein V7O66_10870 [Methanolobus sp. ZRKC3]|uniref:hypothetical protein n=1 Tax=Methanolobus sp. ZRKC3 TaxID=3125786 RepID=UPI00324CEB19
MQILVTDVIDAALIVGIVTIFLFADIIAKHRLKIGIKDISADLAIAAFVIQLAFIANLLTNREIEHLNSNIILAVCFAIFWIVCLWLPSRKDVLADMSSYTLGIFALAISMMHALSISGITGILVVIAASFVLSVIGFLFANNLKNEGISEKFSEITKDLTVYDMNESYRKLDSGRDTLDPLQPVVDIVRGAVRRSDDFTAIKGIHCLADFASKTIISGGNISLIVKHINSNLYNLATLAEEESNRDIIMEIVDAFGVIGSSCTKKGMENLTLQCIENISDFFDLHREKNYFSPLDKLTLIKQAGSPADLFNSLKKNPISTPRHKVAIACGKIGKSAVEQGMIEPVEKIITVLKLVAMDAVSKEDTETVEYVRGVLLEIALVTKDSKFEHLEKQIIESLRDIGIKTVQEHEENKKHSSTGKIVSTLREMGDIFGEISYRNVTNSLHDIAIVAARKHEDEKVVAVIPHIEYFGMLCAERKMDDEASSCVNAIAEITEVSIREKMSKATVSSSKALARLSGIDELSVFVNDAVFELGKYRQIDEDMFTLFEKNYNKAHGK